MAMIFPGMDPYLEAKLIWPGFHNALVVYIRDQLRPLLHPRYIAAVEDRVFLEEPPRALIPDVWAREQSSRSSGGGTAVLEPRVETETLDADDPMLIELTDRELHESYIEILDRQSGQRVVTVIEVLSPTNKTPGPGRDAYLTKQEEVWKSATHLVEIDLLRGGEHTVLIPEGEVRDRCDYDYLVSVNRATNIRRLYETYPRSLRERLPRIGIPLAEGDRDVVLDLQAVVAQTCDAGSYQARLHYDQPCTTTNPALRPCAKQIKRGPRTHPSLDPDVGSRADSTGLRVANRRRPIEPALRHFNPPIPVAVRGSHLLKSPRAGRTGPGRCIGPV